MTIYSHKVVTSALLNILFKNTDRGGHDKASCGGIHEHDDDEVSEDIDQHERSQKDVESVQGAAKDGRHHNEDLHTGRC